MHQGPPHHSHQRSHHRFLRRAHRYRCQFPCRFHPVRSRHHRPFPRPPQRLPVHQSHCLRSHTHRLRLQPFPRPPQRLPVHQSHCLRSHSRRLHRRPFPPLPCHR